DPEEHRRHPHPRPPDVVTEPRERNTMQYDLPDVITVESDGPVRIVRLARPEQLNAINDELHLGLTRLFPQLSADADARVAVITGEGRAFSAGGDFDLLDRMANDRTLRHAVIAALPRQAVEATKRVLNLHLERAVLATIDFAMAAETESFDSDDLRANVAKFLEK